MDKKVIVKIRKIAYSKLRKLEVYRFYNDVIDIISDYDTKAMHIGDSCGVLIDMQPKAQLLKLTDDDLGPSRLTPKVDRLHEKRLKFAATITNQMRTLEMAGLEDKLDLVKLSKDMVYHYLNYLRHNDLENIDVRIDGFFHRLKLEPEVKDALYTLGFKAYLDELETANNAYQKTHSKRNTQLSQRHKGSTIPIQRELQNIMNILFDQVNYYQHVYKDIDYSGLITALNHTIAVYTKLIKTRDTQRKNKKLKAQEENQEKSNLPMIIYKGLEMPENMKLPETTSDSSLDSTKKTMPIPAPERGAKDNVNDKKPNTNNDGNKSSASIKNKGKGEKGGYGRLPPVGKN